MVQNGTEQSARVVKVTAVAAQPDGTQAAKSSTTDVVPSRLAPGETAIGEIRFRAGSIAADPQLTWKVRATRAPSSDDPVRLEAGAFVLSPPMAGPVAQTLDLDVTNPHEHALAGPIEVKVLCLGEAGFPALAASTEKARKTLRAGASAHVTVKLRELCPSYVVAARANLDR